MERAGRTEDDRPPLVDFEDLAGWRVETTQAVATFERSREKPIWGTYVGKLTYRRTGPVRFDPRPERGVSAFRIATPPRFGRSTRKPRPARGAPSAAPSPQAFARALGSQPSTAVALLTSAARRSSP